MSKNAKRRKRRTFELPKSIKEAEERRLELLTDVKRIDDQLGNRDRRDQVTGRRLTDVEYHEWRQRAKTAKRIKEEEYRFLKAWIISARQGETAEKADVDPDDPKELIRRAYLLLKSLIQEFDFDEEDIALIDTLRDYSRR